MNIRVKLIKSHVTQLFSQQKKEPSAWNRSEVNKSQLDDTTHFHLNLVYKFVNSIEYA